MVVEFLVTDDHDFFKSFIQSDVAEKVLRKEVKTILEVQKTVKVKLVGKLSRGSKFPLQKVTVLCTSVVWKE